MSVTDGGTDVPATGSSPKLAPLTNSTTSQEPPKRNVRVGPRGQVLNSSHSLPIIQIQASSQEDGNVPTTSNKKKKKNGPLKSLKDQRGSKLNRGFTVDDCSSVGMSKTLFVS